MRAALITTVLATSTLASADRMPDDAGPPPQVETLDRAAITTGMASAKPKITACGDANKATGKVKVTVVIAPDGRVTKATTDRPAADRLGTCVITAVKSVVFKKTQQGGSFTYPLVFSSPVTEAPVKEADPTAPVDDFDRAAITAGIATVKPKIVACGTKTKATGTVRMRVVVGADGKVTSATAEGTASATLGACVATVMKTVTFKKTPSGGSFSYPFVFGSPTPTPPATTGPMQVPPSGDELGLDRSMITAGIAKVKAKISACGTGANAGVKGTVKIKVAVAPAGTVTTAEVQSAPAEALGACVAGVLKSAMFAKTGQGGSFSYPFVF